MRFLSLFSGIEACSVAWKPLGWQCAGVAEVEPFPCAVLKHHYPDVPNLGDVSKITNEQIRALGPIDVVVGGSPCQDLSVAGKRAGLAGERSGLFHEQVRIFHAARSLCGARFLLWENVPGAFSSNAGRDFAEVVGTLAGCRVDVPAEGWGNEGLALGENGLLEWCVLDAQFFGVAQRRRRVFALLDAGDWAGRPPILLEPEGMRGDSAPRREAGKGIATGLAARAGGGGRPDGGDGRHSHLIPEVVGALTDGAHNGGGSTGRTPTAGASSLLPDVAWCLQERDAKGADSDTKPGHLIPVIGGDFDVAHPLRADGFDASEDGTGRGTPLVAFHNRQDPDVSGDVTHPLGAKDNGLGLGPQMQVRRLTPRECERLQGFPDDYTLVPHRNKPAADGPRYKALGNSMAVPVMRWIGMQISAARTPR